MEHKERNDLIRRKMLDEIADIEAFTAGRTKTEVMTDKMWQKAVVMSLINIGELSKAFSEDFLATMPGIPWLSIRGFRNIAAHQYGSIDFEDVFKTVEEDIPVLKSALESHGNNQGNG